MNPSLLVIFRGAVVEGVAKKNHIGTLQVISGCMYSGKTTELIGKLQALQAKYEVVVVKPAIDKRYSLHKICTHDQKSMDATLVESSSEISEVISPETRVVAIDEAQFFDESLLDTISLLLGRGINVLASGLDTDWRGRPFGAMPKLASLADSVVVKYGVCAICGGSASRTQRLVQDQDDVLIGSHGVYEPRCKAHFEPPLEGASTLLS